ncbi:MAG: Smr/MutS family protein [Treponema sp.]|jgi:DNA-nicking Smr family endonuclease|nr:Smr/MutS family protein [Treponema sp.]
MDFGDILDAWEKQTAIPQGDRKRRKLKKAASKGKKEKTEGKSIDDGEKRKRTDALPAGEPARTPANTPQAILSAWLDTHEIYDKDANEKAARSDAENRVRLLRKEPDAAIDLHNLTQDKAWNALEFFFQECSVQKLEKVLIIHGKGIHSGGEAVLKHLVQKFIENNPLAGESGYNPAKSGGSGATWVILKK